MEAFYSRTKQLSIAWDHGRIATTKDGSTQRVGERHIQFRPMNSEFGIFEAHDADEIEYLRKRAKEVGDVFTAEAFSRMAVPDSVKLAQEEERTRQLAHQNRLLLDELERMKAAKAARAQHEEEPELVGAEAAPDGRRRRKA